VLRCTFDRRYPALAPLHPELVFRLQLEGRLVEASDPDLDERVAGVGRVEEVRSAAGSEAATVIARHLAVQLERLDGPLRIHAERTARLLSAIRAVAPADMHGVTANAIADRATETSAGAYSSMHGRRC
jgi:autotransporter translocation and assembly factor TamB